ncbi:MAG: carboxypeptidase-like regulatory domain-containing protein [Bacteroidales bacterium]|nr:carboxypeptidase-like regulatory domain-containing protein [Bacteroidales bacterium]
MNRKHILLLLLCLILAATFPPQLKAQIAKYTVSGTVTDTKGDPLTGVFVYVKGTENGTTTDLDGKYSIGIPVSGTPVLVFQDIGMENQEVKISKSQTLDIKMKGDNTLEEAVISAGYGLAQKRSDMTGSAFQVNSEQFKTLPASRGQSSPGYGARP